MPGAMAIPARNTLCAETLMYGAEDLLHEDNRYLLSRRTVVSPRLKYAIESSFLARKDGGTQRLSFSRLGSYVAVGFISRDWQPHSTNGGQNALTNIETTIGSEVRFNIARTFLPKFFSHH
jgi:hypothetical protein